MNYSVLLALAGLVASGCARRPEYPERPCCPNPNADAIQVSTVAPVTLVAASPTPTHVLVPRLEVAVKCPPNASHRSTVVIPHTHYRHGVPHHSEKHRSEAPCPLRHEPVPTYLAPHHDQHHYAPPCPTNPPKKQHYEPPCPTSSCPLQYQHSSPPCPPQYQHSATPYSYYQHPAPPCPQQQHSAPPCPTCPPQHHSQDQYYH